MKAYRGYTLIELLVVLGILLVTAIGITFTGVMVYVAYHFLMKNW